MGERNIEITDRTVIVLGCIGKLLYRIFIVVILYNIYSHLIGETTFLAVSTFAIMFPLLWMTMKELMFDMDKHNSKPKNHDSEELATKQTIPTINENT